MGVCRCRLRHGAGDTRDASARACEEGYTDRRDRARDRDRHKCWRGQAKATFVSSRSAARVDLASAPGRERRSARRSGGDSSGCSRVEPYTIVPDKISSDSFVGDHDAPAGPDADPSSAHETSTFASRGGHSAPWVRALLCAWPLGPDAANAPAGISRSKGALSCVDGPRISRDVCLQSPASASCCLCCPPCSRRSGQRRRHRRPIPPRDRPHNRHRRTGLRFRTASTS